MASSHTSNLIIKLSSQVVILAEAVTVSDNIVLQNNIVYVNCNPTVLKLAKVHSWNSGLLELFVREQK